MMHGDNLGDCVFDERDGVVVANTDHLELIENE
jgi:hypothetical protein